MCVDKSSVFSCDVPIPKHPMADLVTVRYSGFSREKCLSHMADFKWRLAFFCPSSFFCGLGLNLDTNYHSLGFSDEFVPMKETCEMIVNKDKIDCEEAEEKLYDSGVLKSHFRLFGFSFIWLLYRSCLCCFSRGILLSRRRK